MPDGNVSYRILALARGESVCSWVTCLFADIMPKIGRASAIVADMPVCAMRHAPFQAALQATALCVTVVK
jgi:hypothetical protein